MSGFWKDQSLEDREAYINLLKVIGGMSNLFSDSASPYLYYRAHENLFCRSFNAKNLSRGDISYDAVKSNVGIGLKTFLNNNGRTFQKVAEFNDKSDVLRNQKSVEDIIYEVANLRNTRLKITQNMTEVRDNVYHLVTREPGRMNIIETPMHLIDINSVKPAKKQGKNTLKFSDKYNEYSFSLSKNTLFQRFNTTGNKILYNFDVSILEDPFTVLEQMELRTSLESSNLNEENSIILPLYSPTNGEVQEKSGLNQWNAGGRKRDINEVYITIPSWIHDQFPDFFFYAQQRSYKGESAKNSPSFNIELPNGEIMNSKVAQQGGKALMSNPNKVLGKWILRDVLNIPERALVTRDFLRTVGIDSVRLTKKSDEYYYLDFVGTGTYERFEEENK